MNAHRLSRRFHALLLLWLVLLAVFIGRPAAATETIVYYHNDALGSPVAVTDATGNLLWRESYRPYGERLNNQPEAASNPIWYTGKRQDTETGLVYMGSRYYHPALGRFLSIDPVEPDENNLHSLNRYAYANNNPYKFTDPDGQAAETIVDLVSLGLSINTFRQDPGFINALAVAYDGFATAVPFLPGGIGIIRQAATKGSDVTQAVKQAADRGAAKAGEGAQKTSNGARTKKVEPLKDADGPHTTWKADPKSGEITRHETWEPNPRNPTGWDKVQSTDIRGMPHVNKQTGMATPTPHTQGKDIPGGVRPAYPSEIPKGKHYSY